MSSLEINKIAGAILLAGIVALVSGILADRLVRPKPAEHAAVAVPSAETGGEAAGEAKPAAEAIEPVAALLAAADPAKSEQAAKKCAACHDFAKDGPNKIGPNLWNIVGRQPGAHAGFAYSDAMKNLGTAWGYEELNQFLAAPKAYAPGTKMTFAGLKAVADRADVIAYLRGLSDAPQPLPEAAATAPAEVAAAPVEAAPAAEVAAETPTAAPAGGEAAPAGAAIAALLAAADPAAGEKTAKKCTACHSLDQGGPNKIGPNLWDIVGRQPGVHGGYAFSDAIKGLGAAWGYEQLDAFLTAPKDYAPGTKMTFAGLKKPEDRAGLIAYLRTLSANPKPLP